MQSLNETLEHRVEEELKKNKQYQEHLFEQAKMASMGEMIGNIAHQWRQPLNAISLTASNLSIQCMMGNMNKEFFEKELGLIDEYSQHLSKTIDTFRNFLMEKKELTEIILQERIDISTNIIGIALKDNNIELQVNIDRDNPIKIKIIQAELSEVIINIINNAKDILLEKSIENPWIKLNLIQEERKVIITIEDNGGGIPKDVRPKIFEAYFTTKHQSEGTGLGLHMSYKIVTESLKGKLWAENSENGAKFFIELPLNSN
ncbi:MAG: HAMP domain-containing sensor histidine kinase [Campylobacterota bacterium]|nr:HAMP domain-containing sensor histidine kinase [Campylobacterota bacterium]